MSKGRVLMASHQGDYLFKLTGDVRMTLCNTIDSCVMTMVQDPRFKSVTVDLNEAKGIDSTSLGLLAKISRIAAPIMGRIPTLISAHPDITRIIETMGFRDRVYVIVEQDEINSLIALEEAEDVPADETGTRERILEAHKILMSLNDKNHHTFKELVECIENQAS